MNIETMKGEFEKITAGLGPYDYVTIDSNSSLYRLFCVLYGNESKMTVNSLKGRLMEHARECMQESLLMNIKDNKISDEDRKYFLGCYDSLSNEINDFTEFFNQQRYKITIGDFDMDRFFNIVERLQGIKDEIESFVDTFEEWMESENA